MYTNWHTLSLPDAHPFSGVNRGAGMKTIAVLGMTLPAAWLAYRYVPGTADYRTAVGERRRIVLADGSQVHLNTSTDMDVRYSERARVLQLQRGEIYIQTAPDAHGLARPFLVETAQGRLRALGRSEEHTSELQSL